MKTNFNEIKTSERFELSKTDLQKALRNLAIIYSPVILLSLDQIQTGEFDSKILIALAVSTTIDIFRRYINDYKNDKVI